MSALLKSGCFLVVEFEEFLGDFDPFSDVSTANVFSQAVAAGSPVSAFCRGDVLKVSDVQVIGCFTASSVRACAGRRSASRLMFSHVCRRRLVAPSHGFSPSVRAG